jgi:hypothetical protein
LLHTIARYIWIWEASSDCDISFAHVKGKLNHIADLLSRWAVKAYLLPKLFNLLNVVWMQPPSDALYLNTNIQCFIFQNSRHSFSALRRGSECAYSKHTDHTPRGRSTRPRWPLPHFASTITCHSHLLTFKRYFHL